MEGGLVTQWYTSPIHFVSNFIQPAKDELVDTQTTYGVIKGKKKIKFLV
jgi:hypothetical protein